MKLRVKRQTDERGYYGPRRWGIYKFNPTTSLHDILLEGGFSTLKSAEDARDEWLLQDQLEKHDPETEGHEL